MAAGRLGKEQRAYARLLFFVFVGNFGSKWALRCRLRAKIVGFAGFQV